MTHYRYARRSEILGKSIYDHQPDTIVLSSGLAYPPLLPDVVREAGSRGRRSCTTEAMQYGPLMGLEDLRESDQPNFVAEDGVSLLPSTTCWSPMAPRTPSTLRCRVFIEPGDRMIVTRHRAYMSALHIMRTHNVNPSWRWRMDEEGLEHGRTRRHELKRLRRQWRTRTEAAVRHSRFPQSDRHHHVAGAVASVLIEPWRERMGLRHPGRRPLPPPALRG